MQAASTFAGNKFVYCWKRTEGVKLIIVAISCVGWSFFSFRKPNVGETLPKLRRSYWSSFIVENRGKTNYSKALQLSLARERKRKSLSNTDTLKSLKLIAKLPAVGSLHGKLSFHRDLNKTPAHQTQLPQLSQLISHIQVISCQSDVR